MKIKVLFICAAFCMCIPAFAQVTVSVATDNPASKEQVQKLFEVMEIRQQSHLMMDSLQKQMQAMTAQTIRNRYPQITAAELARANKISEESMKSIPLDAILDDMIPIYQKHLTQTDVDAMIAFYSSPTGHKLMEEMPQITQEAMQVSYLHMQKQIDSVMKSVDDSMKQDDQPKP
jgi:uncharacterized protein